MENVREIVVELGDYYTEEHNDAMLTVITALADKIEEKNIENVSGKFYYVWATEKNIEALLALSNADCLDVWEELSYFEEMFDVEAQ